MNSNCEKGLPSVEEENSAILILGSFPGAESLEHDEYYHNATNAFWRLLGESYADSSLQNASYEDKIKFLKEKRIALWDVCLSAVNGNRDRSLKKGEANDIGKFLAEHTEVRKVGCNGKNAYKLLKKEFKCKNECPDCFEIHISGSDRVVFVQRLISSSGSANKYTIERKKMWREFLTEE